MSSQVSYPAFSEPSFPQRSTTSATSAPRPSGRDPRAGDAIWLAFLAGERATVYVSGEVDLVNAPQLASAMREALLGERDLTVDLTRVTFFGVSGLNALAEAVSEAERIGRELWVTGAPEITRKLLQVSGLERLMAVPEARPLRAAGEQIMAEGL
jgi:anti-anti-sigma factor